MRYGLIVLWMLFWSATSAFAQVSIGINLSLYPELVRVPGYPVYYAPRLGSNFFFYDGMYWVYQDDDWYASSWYNGPWDRMDPDIVPLFVLRVPVRYYRNPPAYFRQWRSDGPPRWGDHWGNTWEQRRSGWDRWDRRSAPAPAPLPVYQRQYSGDRYPGVEQQRALRSQNYRHQPREAIGQPSRQESRQGSRQEPAEQRAPAPAQRGQQAVPQERSPRQQDGQRTAAPASTQRDEPAVPRAQSPQRGREEVQRSAPGEAPPRQRGPAVQEQPQARQGAAQREQQPSTSGRENAQERRGSPPQEPKRRQDKERDNGDERGHERGQERGQERNR